MRFRLLLVALFLFLLPPSACTAAEAARVKAASLSLGSCVAQCAAACMGSLFEGPSSRPFGARAEGYGMCLAPCSAACLPEAVAISLPNPPPRCAPAPGAPQTERERTLYKRAPETDVSPKAPDSSGVWPASRTSACTSLQLGQGLQTPPPAASGDNAPRPVSALPFPTLATAAYTARSPLPCFRLRVRPGSDQSKRCAMHGNPSLVPRRAAQSARRPARPEGV